MVRPHRRHAELAQPFGCRSRCHAGQRLRILVECQERDDRERRDAAQARSPARAPRGVERLDREEVDATAFEHRGLLGEGLVPLILRVANIAQWADRAGDVDRRGRHLARVSCELHSSRVDRLELLFEKVRGELRRSAPNVFVSISSAPARMNPRWRSTTLCGERRFASSGQRRRGTALAISVPMPPSAQIGGPLRSRSRKEEAIGFTLKVCGRDADRAHELLLAPGGLTANVSCGSRSRTAGFGPPSAWSGQCAASSVRSPSQKGTRFVVSAPQR